MRFLNETLLSALVEQTHLVAIKVMQATTPRRRCIRLQSFNSSGRLANSRNPEEDRSPAPAWWWQPAIEVVAQREEMGALLCYRLQVPVGSTYAAGAAVLMATLADETTLPWPDEFPRKLNRGGIQAND
jgi:hypothetical protein